MQLLLLVIIYITFISLGLPDSLLGSVWPAMKIDLSVPLSYAGAISLIITSCTIFSSFFSGKLIRRLGTGLLSLISVFMTAIALLGFYFLPGFGWLCLAAIPLGLGAGAVDAALNSYIALHYSAKHMNWLHCFWGIGATIGPLIMSAYINGKGTWRQGYLTIALLQFGLIFILLLALPLWNIVPGHQISSDISTKHNKFSKIFAIRGVKPSLIVFFFYCAAEVTIGLWGSSYLVNYRGLSASTGAKWISLYFFSITLGRFLSGFAINKINIIYLSRLGQWLGFFGVVILILPLSAWLSMSGLIIVGIGLSPIIPGMLHDTPRRFGKSESQSIIGIQMAFAFTGSTIMPPFFGLIVGAIGLFSFPYMILALVAVMIIGSERVNLNVQAS